MKYENQAIALLIIGLIALTLLTSYFGSTDIGDYSDVAKYFSGDYNAKIRSSHSYLLGFVHAPFVGFFGNFVIFKITSLIFLILTIFSVYYISGKNKKALWLISLSPIIWYMAPWINPIQAASLIFLWAFYFMAKYEKDDKMRDLIYSGLLIGLGWAVWDTILYLGIILFFIFLYNKKLINSAIFLACIFIGLAPRLILDQYLFNFAFFSTVKTFISGWVNIFGGIYQKGFGHSPKNLVTVVSFLLAIPFSFWIAYNPKVFRENKKEIIFLTLSLLLLFMNPQIRYVMVLAPIMILLSSKYITERGFKVSVYGSVIILLFFIFPYFIQLFHSSPNSQIYGIESSIVLSEGISLPDEDLRALLIKDLESISREYPNESFIVGNHPDNYQVLAHFYWGNSIKEFISIQDYGSYLTNNSVLYRKKFEPLPNIQERRQFWIEGGLKRSDNDNTDYGSIEYGLSLDEPLSLGGFKLEKKYRVLSLYKKL